MNREEPGPILISFRLALTIQRFLTHTTYANLSIKTGISVGALRAIEEGHSEELDFLTVSILARALGCCVSDLLACPAHT